MEVPCASGVCVLVPESKCVENSEPTMVDSVWSNSQWVHSAGAEHGWNEAPARPRSAAVAMQDTVIGAENSLTSQSRQHASLMEGMGFRLNGNVIIENSEDNNHNR